ncbi:disks large-associated protein 5-like [Schistocerca piceifrons]|uniref:disks large-associated protein 5-like n=1 Tax=Schistocerca piceifrons TaxID=274613 RepID=UPI001F5F8FC6|nr:disks large-associated protein 5-like [Schistocerca piceifrons]
MSNKFRIEQKQPKITSVKLRRELTAALMQTERRNKRDNIFNKQRLAGSEEETESTERPVKDVRARQLEAWKRTREEAKKKNKTKRKPFIVTHVRHNIGSPYKTRSPFRTDALLKTKTSKKLDILPEKPATSAVRVTRSMSRTAKLNQTATIQKKNELPKLAPNNFKFKAPKGIAPLPMSSHKQKTDLKITLTPCSVNVEKIGEQKETASTPLSITKRSGRKGSTKETSSSSSTKLCGNPLLSKRKLDYNTSDPNKEPLVAEAVPSDKKTDVSQYRKELNTVIEQLETLCSKWSFTQEQSASLPNEVNDMVDVATGQTKLLIKEKLAQYRGLIDECEKNSGPVRVTESDLQGFWEMVNLQVQNVISKFEELDVLKDNNWTEPKKQHSSPLKKKKGVTKISKTKQVASKSSVRDHIAALRRAKAAMQCSEPKDPNIASFIPADPASKVEKQSNQRANCTPVVVLIRAQLSEKQKRNSRCSTALMKITNHLREISTPETGNKVNSTAADGRKSSRRLSSRMKQLTPDVLNNDKEAEFEPHITPPSKTYSKSPKKSGDVPEEDEQFDLLRKTPTFLHSSSATGKPKKILNKETPRSRRQQRVIGSPK